MPHSEPWYFRALKLFKQIEHPVNDGAPKQAPPPPGSAGDLQQQGPDMRSYYKLDADRLNRYRIFSDMDFGQNAAIADLYSEEATLVDYDKRKVLWVEDASDDTKTQVTACLDNLMIQTSSTGIIRESVVLGDHFRRVAYAHGSGVHGWSPRDPLTMTRIQDNLGRLVGFKETGQQYRGDLKREVSWPWDYAHFKLPGKYDASGYGTGLYDTLFVPWRQLALGQDSKLTYMVRKAPDRNAIMVDIGDLDDVEGMQYVNMWKQSFQGREFIDPASPAYRQQFVPLTPWENLFIPVRGQDTNSRIEQVAGSGSADNVYDLNYFRDNYYSAARVPKWYVGLGEGPDGGSGKTLMRQDVRFARWVMNLQRSYIFGVRTVTDLHLVLRGADPDKLPPYMLQMAPVSYLAELERLEVIRMRTELLEALANLGTTLQLDTRAWATYILTEYGRLPEASVARLMAKANAPAGAPDGTAKAEGAYSLSKEEKRIITEAIARSAGLQHSIRFLSASSGSVHLGLAADDQRDPSILQPILENDEGGRVEDSTIKRGADYDQLFEDMKTFHADRKLKARKVVNG